MLEKDFKDIMINIKQDFMNTQYKTMIVANEHLINFYFRLGKILSENSEWGNKFIDNVSIELNLEFPDIKGFSIRNLKRIKAFYEEYKESEIMPQLVAQIPWGHNIILIEKIKDVKIREWYINECIKNGWSRNILEMQIKSDLYLRQEKTEKLTNFNTYLSDVQSDLATQTLKDPYIFDFITLKERFKERELENAMVEKIKKVLLELGNGFSFVGNQYKITVDNQDFYIDLLFYHLNLRCFIVVELKAGKFKPEYVGKLNFYLSALDDKLKKENDNPTIGLILCQEKDKFTVEYSLKNINSPIGISSYEISKVLPKDIINELPTEEDINLHIDINEED